MIGHPAAPPTIASDLRPTTPAVGLAPPDVEELQGTWATFYDQLSAGRVDPTGEHGDEYVAFFDGRVQGYGSDATELRYQVAARLGVHPERLVVSHLAD